MCLLPLIHRVLSGTDSHGIMKHAVLRIYLCMYVITIVRISMPTIRVFLGGASAPLEDFVPRLGDPQKKLF